ncbi:hypothetical protein AJ88_47200 [Mesorhizobium amorphae CCBAU 01583]|nr:hypothetical protein AJ88_47200 [Mesorhizobium amorphae CCBAU 01583]
MEPQARAAYERFGLNERQIDLIARATPKRQYYLQSRRGNRLFELGLGPITLALCGASDPATQTLIDRVLFEHGQDGFASHFLNSRASIGPSNFFCNSLNQTRSNRHDGTPPFH